EGAVHRSAARRADRQDRRVVRALRRAVRPGHHAHGHRPHEGRRDQAAAGEELLVNPEMEEVPNDDPDKAGRIAEQNPAAGSKVLEGDEVTLKVYAKPEMVTVTDFTGQMFEEAKAGLE